MTMTEKVAYAAGLFDGEGYVGLEFSPRKRATIMERVPIIVVAVQMCTPQGPSLFAELFGGNVRLRARRTATASGKEYRPHFVWHLMSAKAVKVLIALRPYLREKAAQVDLCLEARRIQEGRPKGQGATYRPEDRIRLAEIHTEVKALKRAPAE